MAVSPASSTPPLERYRVLDFSDERGLLCGQLLADLGTDVVVVEPPGGSRVRRFAPFYQDLPDPNGSLYWWAYNRNKRAITLNLGAAAGKALAHQLIAGADFLIESASPGRMEELGLGYDEAARINPRLIYVSITPFGQAGPKANWASSDLVVLAAGGPLALTGDDDRPPLRVAVPQAYLHAAADGALGAMLAHFHRVRSGRGQHVDVSAQQSVAIATQSGALATLFNAAPFRRHRGGLRLGILENQIIWPARDGHVTMAVAFGANAGPFMVKIRQFLYEQSRLPEADPELKALSPQLEDGRWPEEARDAIIAAIRRFTQRHTKAQLMEIAQRHGLLIGSLETLPDVFASPQLSARGYWRMVEHPELTRAFAYPGPFARFGTTPIQYRRRPPTVGEHNNEVYAGELGLGAARIRELEEAGVI
ncbi:MAG TPA: CaiB/BaiF CoA-transferase family protein [Candidatus Binataceae bacterium]|nr:CaiB/BaiF CoA-transferase family protein [Candidatus Binataceae bacterium]